MDKISKALEQARSKRQESNVSFVDKSVLEKTEEMSDDISVSMQENEFPVKTFTPNALTLEKNRILNQASREEIVQPYKVLRTRLLQILEDKNWSSIAVVSPTKDDGKTTVAINLSISIGNSLKNNAVLLDLDLLTPSIHNCYGYQPSCGLEDYFENDMPLSEILVSPNMEGLYIAPSIRPLRDSSEFITTSKGAELVTEAKSISLNSIVIVDLPPVLVSDDAISFLPHIDAVLLVVREGKTSKTDVERTQEMLANVNIAGVVVNDSVEPTTLGYY